MPVAFKQLQHIQVFAVLGPHILEVLAQQAAILSYVKGEILIHEGDRFPPCFHAVLVGELQVIKIAASGKETILRSLSTGQMFAAPALFGDGIAVATVKALQETQVITIPRTALIQAIQRDPSVALNILAYFNQRLQEMHCTIHGLISEQAIVRLAQFIEYSAQRYGTSATQQGEQLNSQLTYHHIARSIGISYEETVRLMGQRLNHILIYQRGGIITILDAIALGAIASGE